MAAPVCIAGTWNNSLCEHWATIVHSGVRNELTRTLQLNTVRVQDT